MNDLALIDLRETRDDSTARSLATQTQTSRARRHAASCLLPCSSTLPGFLLATVLALCLGFLSLAPAEAAFPATALVLPCCTRNAMAQPRRGGLGVGDAERQRSKAE
jgi:hypothetical protein